MKRLTYLANIRFPTEKAHGLQIAKMCEAFARAGASLTLQVARRKNPIQETPFEFYRVEPLFEVLSRPCLDTLRWPRFLGPLTFPLLSLSFALACRVPKEGWVYARDPYTLTVQALWKHPRLVVELHDWPESHPALYRWLFKRIAKFVVITHGLKKKLLEWQIPEEKIFVAPDGLDLLDFANPLSKTAAREKLHLPQDKKIAVYTGHLYSWKGGDTLAKAVAHLPPEWELVIVGGHEQDRARVAGHLSPADRSRVRFQGLRPHAEIPTYLWAAGALVIPNSATEAISREYTSPLKVFEYLAAGRPIVASRLPSLLEVLEENKHAFFATPDDPVSLAAAIDRVRTEPDLAAQLATKNQTTAPTYTWQNRAEGILKFLGGSVRRTANVAPSLRRSPPSGV